MENIRRLAAVLSTLLLIFLSGCKSTTSAKVGSLNESGTPSRFLATLQSRVWGNFGDIKNQQALENIQVGTDKTESLFYVADHSKYFIEQLSFACDVGRNQFIFFTWDVGVDETPARAIQWLIPDTPHRLFPATRPAEVVVLLHNSPDNNEALSPSQVSWLIRKYKPHNCVPLDIADGREEDPRIARITPPDKGDVFDREAGCQEGERLGAICKKKGVKPSHDTFAEYGGYQVPLPELPSFTVGKTLDAGQPQVCDTAFQWQNYCRVKSK
jgi:hypothetical protein